MSLPANTSVTHGPMYSYIVNYRAKKLKEAETRAASLANGRLILEVLHYCPRFILKSVQLKLLGACSHTPAEAPKWGCKALRFMILCYHLCFYHMLVLVVADHLVSGSSAFNGGLCLGGFSASTHDVAACSLCSQV
jgi:hypothetical protein